MPLTRAAKNMGGAPLSPSTAHWLRHAYPNPCALLVVETITGIPLLNRHIYPDLNPYPRNGQDVYAIHDLLRQCPDLRPHLPMMEVKGEQWRLFVANCDTLARLLANEVRTNMLAPAMVKCLENLYLSGHL